MLAGTLSAISIECVDIDVRVSNLQWYTHIQICEVLGDDTMYSVGAPKCNVFTWLRQYLGEMPTQAVKLLIVPFYFVKC